MKFKRNISALLVALLLTRPMLPVQAAEGEAAADTTSEATVETTVETTAITTDPTEALTREELAQQAIEAVLAISGADSVQYALYESGELTLSGSAGSFSRTEDTAISDDTLYGIGSISKMYTTVAVLKLAEEGKLDLDTAVYTYLPDFTMADERYKEITVRMLLNHSSGLMGDSVGSSVLFDDTSYNAKDSLLEALSTERLQAAPGAYSVYCNDGFTMAELVIEAVSGMSFEDYVQEKLLTPAGLSNTYFPGGNFDTGRLAKTYAGAEDNRELPVETLSIVGAGGIYASAADVAKFGALFMGGNDILTDSSWLATQEKEYLRGMWPENSTIDSLAYGLGWDNVHVFPFVQDGITAMNKGGDTLRYHGSLVVMPEYDMSIAVLSSGGVSTYDQLGAERILIDILAEKGITVNESGMLPEAEPAEMPEELLAYAGTYASKTFIATMDFTDDGTLLYTYANVFGGETEEYTYYSDGTFRNETNSWLVRFVTEENGHAYLFELGYGEIPGLTTLGNATYTLERLEENNISEELAQLWIERGNNLYFIVNERYNSQVYLTSPFAALTYVEEAPGYVGGVFGIVDESRAEFYLQIPGAGSRSGSDIIFYTENDIELIKFGDYVIIGYESLNDIYSDGDSMCTIEDNGYAKWYNIGGLAGKTITVTLQENGAFYVYDANGLVVSSSIAWGDSRVTLPEGGWIVFAGEAGAQFYIAVSE